MGVLHGERVDKAVTAISSAAVVGRKFHIFKSEDGPKVAVLQTINGGAISGVSRTQTDGAGEEFELVAEGTILVDVATAALAIDTECMCNPSGDVIIYSVATGNRAVGMTRSVHAGGAGLQIMVELYATPTQPDEIAAIP